MIAVETTEEKNSVLSVSLLSCIVMLVNTMKILSCCGLFLALAKLQTKSIANVDPSSLVKIVRTSGSGSESEDIDIECSDSDDNTQDMPGSSSVPESSANVVPNIVVLSQCNEQQCSSIDDCSDGGYAGDLKHSGSFHRGQQGSSHDHHNQLQEVTVSEVGPARCDSSTDLRESRTAVLDVDADNGSCSVEKSDTTDDQLTLTLETSVYSITGRDTASMCPGDTQAFDEQLSGPESESGQLDQNDPCPSPEEDVPSSVQDVSPSMLKVEPIQCVTA